MIILEDYLNSNYVFIRDFFEYGDYVITASNRLTITGREVGVYFVEFYDKEEVRNLNGKVVSFKNTSYLADIEFLDEPLVRLNNNGELFKYHFLILHPL